MNVVKKPNRRRTTFTLIKLGFWGMTCLPSLLRATTFDVMDHGAKGDGVANDQPAIQATIEAAIEAGPDNTVSLPAGTFLLTTKNAKTGDILDIKKSTGLTFTGAGVRGTKLISTQKMTKLLQMDGNSKLLVENFSVDYAPMGYSQGTITDFSPVTHTVTYTTDPGFDQPDRPDLLPANYRDLYLWSNPKRVTYDAYWGPGPKVKSYTQVSPGVWLFTLDHPPATKLFVGEKAVIWGDNNEHAFEFSYNQDVSITDVSLFNEGWNTGFICVGNTGAINLTRFNVMPAPGHFLSAASGSACGNRGALTMDGCNIIAHNDDAVNTATGWVPIVTQPGSNQISIDHGDHLVSDRIEIWDWPPKSDGNQPPPSLLKTFTITSVERNASGKDVLTLSNEVTLPNGVGSYKVIDLDDAGPVVVRNGSYASCRARPLLLKSGVSVLVENTLIYDSPMPLKLGAEVGWGEGPRPNNITVRHNTFRDMDTSAIFIGVDGAAANNLATNVVISDNLIEDGGQEALNSNPSDHYGNGIWVQNATSPVIRHNLFKNNWDANIALQNCTDVQILNNIFDSPNEIQPTHPSPVFPGTIIWADNVQGLTLSNNTVTNPGPFNKSLLYMTATVSGVMGVANTDTAGPGALK